MSPSFSPQVSGVAAAESFGPWSCEMMRVRCSCAHVGLILPGAFSCSPERRALPYGNRRTGQHLWRPRHASHPSRQVAMIRHVLWPPSVLREGLCFARCIAPRDGRTGRAPLVRSLSASLLSFMYPSSSRSPPSGRCVCRPAFAASGFM